MTFPRCELRLTGSRTCQTQASQNVKLSSMLLTEAGLAAGQASPQPAPEAEHQQHVAASLQEHGVSVPTNFVQTARPHDGTQVRKSSG